VLNFKKPQKKTYTKMKILAFMCFLSAVAVAVIASDPQVTGTGLKYIHAPLWHQGDVAIWLQTIRFAKYVPDFSQLTGQNVLEIQEAADLEQYGVEQDDLKPLMFEIVKLKLAVSNHALSKRQFWDAFDANPSLTYFLLSCAAAAPRSTYVMMYALNPELLRAILHPESIGSDTPYDWELKMVIFPEFFIIYRAINNENASFGIIIGMTLLLFSNWINFFLPSNTTVISYGTPFLIAYCLPSTLLRLFIYGGNILVSLGFILYAIAGAVTTSGKKLE